MLFISGKICRCGGIGRHDRLKICFSLESVGSTPTIGTNFNVDNVRNSKYNLSRDRLVLYYWANSCVYLYRA